MRSIDDILALASSGQLADIPMNEIKQSVDRCPIGVARWDGFIALVARLHGCMKKEGRRISANEIVYWLGDPANKIKAKDPEHDEHYLYSGGLDCQVVMIDFKDGAMAGFGTIGHDQYRSLLEPEH